MSLVPEEGRKSGVVPDASEGEIDRGVWAFGPTTDGSFRMRPGGPKVSDICPGFSPLGPRIFRAGLESMFVGFFPYQYIDARRAVVPIDPEYEPRLVGRVRELASLVGAENFSEKLHEAILRDLFSENPHYCQTGRKKSGLINPTVSEGPELSSDRRGQIEDLFRLREKVVFPSLKSIPMIGKLLPDTGRTSHFRQRVDIEAEISKCATLPERALILLLGMRHGMLEQEEAVKALLGLTSELARSGYYQESITLMELAIERGPVSYSSRVCVLVDQMAKVHFAEGDFIRAEQKFEEVARHGRFVDNSRPYNFHVGIINLASGRLGKANWFLEKCAVGFHSPSDQAALREATAELLARLRERGTRRELLLPELGEA